MNTTTDAITQRDAFLYRLAALKLRAAMAADKATEKIRVASLGGATFDELLSIARAELVPAQDEVARLEAQIEKLLATTSSDSWGTF